MTRSERQVPAVRALRAAGAVAGGGALALALVAPAFRDAEGHLTGAFVVPLAFGMACLSIAAFAKRDRLAFLLWLGLLLVGQAAALQLVRAGRGVGYQHYVPLRELFGGPTFAWSAILLIQAVAVGAGLVRVLPSLLDRLARAPSPWRAAGVLAILFATGAAASRNPSLFAGELALAFIVQLTGIANAVLLVMALPDHAVDRVGGRLRRVLGGDDDAAGSFWGLDAFVILAAVWAVFATAMLGLLAYQWHPHVPDEVVYLLHAKYLAAGRLDLPLPLVPDAFSVDLMTYDAARWYSPVPPGWPIVLAAGVRLGVTWLVNPLLSGLSVVASYILVRDLLGRRLARLTVILLCVSPWFLFLGMSLMTHQLTLAAALVAAVAAARLRRGGAAAWGILSGAGIGMLAVIRPLEGLIAAVLLGLWVLVSGRLRERVLPVAVMAAASIAATAPVLAYNVYFTGDPTYFPIMAYTDALYGPGSNALGFGENRGLPFGGLDPFPGHGMADAAVNSALNAFQVNTELLGWMTGSLVLIGVLLVSRSMRREDAWMLAVVVAVTGAHAFYWFSGGPDFGARYWYLILVPCLILSARGLDVVSHAFREGADRLRPVLATLGLCVGALVVFVPWRAADKYFHYRGMRPDVRELIEAGVSGRALILVRGVRMPDYMSAVPYAALVPGEDSPAIAWDRDDALRRSILEAHADRDVWILEGPTLTGEGYRLVAGPVPAQRLLRDATGER